jgi:hypothetical protein
VTFWRSRALREEPSLISTQRRLFHFEGIIGALR